MAGISKTNKPQHRFTYNGKEKQEEFGLNWLDYGARNYEASIGRWHSVDPELETFYSLTPYNYVENKPLSMIDPDGRSGKLTIDKQNRTVTISAQYYFYGGASNQKRADRIVGNMMTYLNGANGKLQINGVTYSVKFDIKGKAIKNMTGYKLGRMFQGEEEANFVRLETRTTAANDFGVYVSNHGMKRSHGFFILDEVDPHVANHKTGLIERKTTGFHEFLHGLGLVSRQNGGDGQGHYSDGKHVGNKVVGQPSSMHSRGTYVEKYYQYNTNYTPIPGNTSSVYRTNGRNGGTLDPSKRRVTQRDITQIYRENGSAFQKAMRTGRANMGKFKFKEIKKK